ncbi:hypothetical protein A6A04_03655 [Paramagnetospirillum marisnigri]|uniref:Uncharacterized protein n=1 Tax=Paramagnetospirillum marisnigri TaxID=1285242 RepID=A0A178MKL1_9PROT|nr:Gfo/Idh/MocA family oxidoreductase [Paramagnetospirillum marisnigri]OAN49220.1 hypothetical protein A6A04_03655 [Paramagnetospirillum marisnigri]
MASIPARSEAPIRLALIGAGRWGRIHLKTISGLDGTVLTRVASSNPETVALVPPGCVVEADWRAVVAASDVDAVVIVTPPATHAEIALAAIRAGKPVLVEKPLTLDPAEADSILAAADSADILAWVEHTQLFQPGWAVLKAALPTIGALRALRAEAGNHGPFRAGVEPLWDWGAHDVALVLDLMGADPLSCSGIHERREEIDGGIGALARLSLGFEGGVEAVIRCGSLMPTKRRRIALHGEAGVLVLDDLANPKLTRHPPTDDFAWPIGPGEALPVDGELPLSRALRLFVQAVRSGSRDRVSLALGVRVVRILARVSG